MTPPKTKRTTVSELAKTLAEGRSRASASVTAKVASNGTWHGEATTTAETTEEEIDRMTDLAIRAVTKIAGNATAGEVPF